MAENPWRVTQRQGSASGKRSERIVCAIAVVVLVSCLVCTLGSCGGDDLVIGGNVPVPPTSGVTPTEAP